MADQEQQPQDKNLSNNNVAVTATGEQEPDALENQIDDDGDSLMNMAQPEAKEDDTMNTALSPVDKPNADVTKVNDSAASKSKQIEEDKNAAEDEDDSNQIKDNAYGDYGDDDDYGAWGDYGDEEGDEYKIMEEKLPEMKKKNTSYFGKQQYIITHIDEVEKMMPSMIEKTQDLLGLDEDKAIAVLRHFQWNTQKIQDQWFTMDDSKFVNIGLDYDKELAKKNPEIDSTTKDNNGNMCMVMYAEFEDGDPDYGARWLCCGHQFSNIAWRMYLKEKVREQGPASVLTRCAQSRCNVVIPHSFFLSCLDDSVDDDGINYYKKYKNWHIKQFADFNKQLKFCPTPGCEYVVQKSDFCIVNEVMCKCGSSFCIKCEREDHLPANCQQVTAWLFKEQDSAENLTWIKANTKPCPKCSTFIEKNQGCNHMQCQKCHHHFCWLCLGDWKDHGSATGGYYACNIFEKMSKEDKTLAGKLKEVQDAKNELARYVYSFERYQNHSRSRDIAKKQLPRLRKNVEQLHQIKKYPLSELEFFEECSQVVIQCRQVLKWTYVIDYFSKDLSENERELFKYQQGELENFCEMTHQLLESDMSKYLDVGVIDRSPFFQFKAEVTNNMSALKHSVKTLVTDTQLNPKFQFDGKTQIE